MNRGIVLDRWARGLLVMLEKIVGCAFIGDFNAANKIVFCQQMIDNARKHNIVPEDIHSEKNCLADNGTLAKSHLLQYCLPNTKTCRYCSCGRG
jgi:hypothetical protein